MQKRNWLKGIKLSIHSPGTGAALILLALTQVPVAIKTAAEVACIGQVSNQIWRETKSHAKANVTAIRSCNGGLANPSVSNQNLLGSRHAHLRDAP